MKALLLKKERQKLLLLAGFCLAGALPQDKGDFFACFFAQKKKRFLSLRKVPDTGIRRADALKM
jgi:hypothetical protein